MTVSRHGSPPKRGLARAIVYSLAALVCFMSAAILHQSPRYGWIAVAIQLVLGFCWTIAASASWHRWLG